MRKLLHSYLTYWGIAAIYCSLPIRGSRPHLQRPRLFASDADSETDSLDGGSGANVVDGPSAGARKDKARRPVLLPWLLHNHPPRVFELRKVLLAVAAAAAAAAGIDGVSAAFIPCPPSRLPVLLFAVFVLDCWLLGTGLKPGLSVESTARSTPVAVRHWTR